MNNMASARKLRTVRPIAKPSDFWLTTLNSTCDGILILNQEGVVMFSNRAANELLKVKHGSLDGTVFGLPMEEGSMEIQIARKDGVRIVEMHVCRRRHDPDLTIANLRDITDHVNLRKSLSERNKELEKLNEELRVARDKALQLSKLKSQFIANVSHEIRTPMAGIIGLSELMTLDETLNQDQHDLAQDVCNSAARLLKVLNDLLDFSKLDAGRFHLDEKSFVVEEILAEIESTILPAATKKGLNLQVCVENEIPSTLFGDELKLRQSLLNLAHNAVKFTETGEIKIAARLLDYSKQKAIVEFSVVDTGIGISCANTENLFEPFVQADGSVTRKFGGTGLGLSITKGFVELMGGAIKVESKAGAGSTFSFSVPFALAS
jgi:signal transduction histidine kinase